MATIQKLKAERAVAKAKVTRLVNVLDPILSKKGSEAKEEWDKVHDHATKLEEALLNLKRAHKKYAESLESEKGEEEIEAVANENNQYLTEAESPAYETLKKLKGYKDEVKKVDEKEHIETNKLPALKKVFRKSYEKFKDEIGNAQTVLEDFDSKSTPEVKKVPSLKYLDVSGVKSNLQEAYNSLRDAHSEYVEALESVEMDFDTAMAAMYPDEQFSMKESGALTRGWVCQANIVLEVQKEVLRDEELKRHKLY